MWQPYSLQRLYPWWRFSHSIEQSGPSSHPRSVSTLLKVLKSPKQKHFLPSFSLCLRQRSTGVRELTLCGRPHRAHMQTKRVHVTRVSGPGGGQREGERDEGTYQTPDTSGFVEAFCASLSLLINNDEIKWMYLWMGEFKAPLWWPSFPRLPVSPWFYTGDLLTAINLRDSGSQGVLARV